MEDASVIAAWQAYLSRTRNLIGHRYFEEEPKAWKALLTKLKRKRVSSVGA